MIVEYCKFLLNPPAGDFLCIVVPLAVYLRQNEYQLSVDGGNYPRTLFRSVATLLQRLMDPNEFSICKAGCSRLSLKERRS